jgi:hypothetical protein
MCDIALIIEDRDLAEQVIRLAVSALPAGRAPDTGPAAPAVHRRRVVPDLSAGRPDRPGRCVMTARAPAGDRVLRYELDALRALAARVIDEHVECQGTCLACGRTFPCPRACLAEHNLQICGQLPPDLPSRRRRVS